MTTLWRMLYRISIKVPIYAQITILHCLNRISLSYIWNAIKALRLWRFYRNCITLFACFDSYSFSLCYFYLLKYLMAAIFPEITLDHIITKIIFILIFGNSSIFLIFLWQIHSIDLIFPIQIQLWLASSLYSLLNFLLLFDEPHLILQ